VKDGRHPLYLRGDIQGLGREDGGLSKE
jgi:hypothetical protein